MFLLQFLIVILYSMYQCFCLSFEILINASLFVIVQILIITPNGSG